MKSMTVKYRNLIHTHLSSTQGTGSDHKDIVDDKIERGVVDFIPLGASGNGK